LLCNFAAKVAEIITFFGILRLKLDIRCHFYTVESITEIYGLLGQKRRVVITMHQKPDADALGSSLGLYHFLVKLGHEVTVVSPTNWPRFLNWMPDCSRVVDFEGMNEKGMKALQEAEWVFCLDFNVLSRTKRMAPVLENLACTKILIDHHEEPQAAQFAYGISNPLKSSTAEMVYDFIVHSGHGDKIDEKIGECLYAGVMTDTGSFRFPNTTASVHRMIADLKDRGLKHSIVHEHIYDNFLENRFRFMGHALLNRMEIYYEYNAALISISKADLLKFEIQTGDTEGLVNFPLSIQGIRMAGLVIDRDEERKWSFRSKGGVDVNTFARTYFNGGGHFNAAGGRTTDSLAQTAAAFRKALAENAQTLQTEYAISQSSNK
jgi:phosphoesterase RecJ-like protein